MAKLYVEALDLGGEAGLGEVVLVVVDTEDARGTTALHFHRVEAGVAADVEHRLAAEIGGKAVVKALPLHLGVVAEEVVGRSTDAMQVEIVLYWPLPASQFAQGHA